LLDRLQQFQEDFGLQRSNPLLEMKLQEFVMADVLLISHLQSRSVSGVTQ
jgi:hypothetical protein